MGSKSVKIVIIIAVIIGIIAIVGITALVVITTKSSGPRVIDLNDEEQVEKISGTDLETEDNERNENEEENTEGNESSAENSTDSEPSALELFNAKLKEYEGERVSGKKVNELLDIIRRNNEQNPDYQIKALASVQNWDSGNNKAKEDSMYNVNIEEDEQTRNITKIEIKDAD